MRTTIVRLFTIGKRLTVLDTIYGEMVADLSSCFKVRWIYCKTVSFDIIRQVDVKYDGDSVTQMWNGM